MHVPFAASMTVAAVAFLLGGCATNSGWKTRNAPEGFVDGTVVLAEVILPARREQVLRGEGLLAGWRDALLAAGIEEREIVDGSEVTVWSYCYGHNSGVPLCAHHGHYVAHLPLALRDGIRGNVADGSSGELVEVRLRRLADGKLFGEVIGIHSKGPDWGNCREARLQPSDATVVVTTVSMVGPPRAKWIECTDAERDGWVRRPVAGAPFSHGSPVSEWIRLPR